MDPKAPHQSAIYRDEVSSNSRKTFFPRECGLMQKELLEKEIQTCRRWRGKLITIALNTVIQGDATLAYTVA